MIAKFVAAMTFSTLFAFPAATAAAQSGCADLGGAVDPAGTCHVEGSGPNYRMELAFPTDYPDEAALTGYVAQRRDDFLGAVAASPGPAYKELFIDFDDYRAQATRTVVLTIGSDTGVHPVTSYRSFTFDVAKNGPVTIDTLFTPGSRPLDVLNPLVGPELEQREAQLPVDGLTLNDDRSFALTDDSVLFFFDQDAPMPHVSGPLTVTVPRAALASVLAV